MKTSQTTIAGRVAGVTLALSSAPDLPTWLRCALTITAAVAVIYLGHRAADCPINCPGTDTAGRPRDPRHDLRMSLAMLAAAALTVIILSGCTTANPAHVPGTTNTPPYVVSPAVNGWSNALVPIAQPAGQTTGTGDALPQAVAGVFALVAAISGYVAARKNAQANTLAAAVADQGPEAVANALAYASDTPHYAPVAAKLNAQMATGQAPGQPLPLPAKKQG
jgi:hypothetical protein